MILDIKELNNSLERLKEQIETINLWFDNEIKVKGIDDFKKSIGDKLTEQKR